MQEMQEMRVWSLDQEDPLKEEMSTHSSTLAWEIPWTEEAGGLQSTGWQVVEEEGGGRAKAHIAEGRGDRLKWGMVELPLFSGKRGRRPGSGCQPWHPSKGFLSVSWRHGKRNNMYFGSTISIPSKFPSAASSILYQYAITIYQLPMPET